MAGERRQRGRGGVVCLVGLGLLGGCASQPVPLEPAAKKVVDQARGLCPTDLNEAQVMVAEKDDAVRLIFTTGDPSQNEALHRRVVELGEALANKHPAVNEKGERVEHVPLPKPELREAALSSSTPPRYGWELVVNATGEQSRAQVRADLEDHVRMIRAGECPEMTDESVRPAETKGWEKVDR